MTDGGRETAINDYLTDFLLRYFRKAAPVDIRNPDVSTERDLHLLRLHWTLSEPVRELVRHLLQHPHEIQAVLASQRREDEAQVRGRLDARATTIQQLVTGRPTLTVSYEPVRTFASGPNHVLVWVLQAAWQLAQRFKNLLPDGAGYGAAIGQIAPGLESIRRIDAVRQAAKAMDLTRRPTPQAMKEASRSRRRIYVLASTAYRALRSIEAGDKATVTKLLQDTLLGPLPLWQRYELAVGLGVARALGVALSEPVALGFLAGAVQPIARVNGYEIHWQTSTNAYEQPQPEPSEELTARLLKQYGVSLGGDRPDLVVLNGDGEAVSIVEVKYYSSGDDDRTDALRDAVGQLVRYARGYRAMQEVEEVLDHSIVAVARHVAGRTPDPKGFGLPLIVDFEAIQDRQLDVWARRLVGTVGAAKDFRSEADSAEQWDAPELSHSEGTAAQEVRPP